MITLGRDIKTVGDLKSAVEDISDDVLLNIGNAEYGFSIDKIDYNGISIAFVSEEMEISEPIPEGKVTDAVDYLVKNGIVHDKAETILQELGNILFGIELIPERAQDSEIDTDMDIEVVIGMTGTLKNIPMVKKELRGKPFVITDIDKDGSALCSIEGKKGNYFILKSFMANVTFPEPSHHEKQKVIELER